MAASDDYGEFPLKEHLGLELDDVEDGRARARLVVEDRHLNPNAVAHGAVLFAMVDTAMGRATMSVLDEGQFCASVEVSLRFVRPAGPGALVADVQVLKRGRSVVHLQGRVVDGDERLIATADGTFTVIELAP